MATVLPLDPGSEGTWLSPHSLAWSEEECAGSKGKCPRQARPPLRDYHQVLETSELLALTANTKFISILPRAECTSLSPSKAVCIGCE